MTKHASHDLGGVEPDASAPIDRTDHALSDFDKNVDALVNLLSRPESRIIRVDELRRAIEALPPADYRRLGYYQRWLTATVALLIEKDVLDRAEIDAKMASLHRTVQ